MRAALVAEARTIAAHSAVSLPEHADCLTRLADALEAAEARVKELEAQLANAKAGWGSALRIVNSGNEIIKQVGAERDAALAALERVRAVVKSINFLAGLPPFDKGTEAMTAISADLLAALDGAPEPEAERDAALARIAELEKSYRIVERLYKIERQERIEAEARIAEAAKHPAAANCMFSWRSA